MCGCAYHQSHLAFCTCDCPSHKYAVKWRAAGPKHRADVPVDRCNAGVPSCPICADYTRRATHRAEPTS